VRLAQPQTPQSCASRHRVVRAVKRAISCGDGLLRERTAIKMTHEDLHEGGAMQIGQARNFADDAHVAKALDGLAVLAVLVTDKYDAVHGQLRGVESGQCQQSVIHGPDTAARGQDYRELEFHHHVQHELLLVDGNQDSADSLNNDPIIIQAAWEIDAAKIDLCAGPPRGQVGRDRRNEFIHLIYGAVCANASEAHHGDAIRTLECPSLNRFPIHGVERRAQQRRERGLAYSRIRTCDEELIPQPRPSPGVRGQTKVLWSAGCPSANLTSCELIK